MEEEQKSYNSIFKATSIFGGVQVFQVIIQIIRSKIVAILLGPAGIGILGALNVTVNFIGSITNFGIGTSAIQEIAEANEKEDKTLLFEKYSVLNKLVWFTGILGMLISIAFSPLISKLTFGNYKFTYAFVWLSISLMLNQLASGKIVILQGLRKLKLLAKANLFGSTMGLIIVFPIFYFLGNDGIVFSIIIYSLSSYFFAWYFTKSIIVHPVKIAFYSALIKGKKMMSLGFVLGISGLITVLSNYLINIFILKFGSVEELGLYSAGIAITTNYTGLIFTAIATDYHPRLAALTSNNLIKKTVNHQAEIALLILAPLILIFLFYGDLCIELLYSKDFLSIKQMINFILLGTFFKLFSWAISFTFVARGKIKLFFWNELIANIYVLAFGLFGYYQFGLTGLGYSYITSYIIYSIQVYYLANKIFNFHYEKLFFKNFFIQFSIIIISFFGISIIDYSYKYLISLLFIGLSSFYSIIELNKKVNIKSFLNSKI